MASDHLDMHIVLNEESIDLRKETFEKPPVKIRSAHRTTSQQIISPTQNSGDLRDRKPIRVNGLRKLANNLCYGEQTSILQRNKSTLRNKQRNRATSADPRFRRERSPVYAKEASQTQSDSQVMDLPTQFKKKKNKTHSDSKFILENVPNSKKTIPKPSGPYPTDQSEPVNFKANLNVEVPQKPKSEDDVNKTVPNKESAKYSTTSNIYSCDNVTTSNIEQSTMTEGMKSWPTAADCKSLYHSAMTNTEFTKNNADIELYNAAGIYFNEKEPLQSYWDDPRLIEKYSKLLKPVHIHKSKSSFTLPFSKPLHASYIKPRPAVCSKCVCADLYNEFGRTDERDEEVNDKTANYERIKTSLYDTMRENYYLAAFFMIGSICGLMLVTLVVWVLANDIIWSYLNKQEPRKLTGFKWLTAYIGGGILHSINVVFNKICYMVIMPRNEVFDID